MFQLNVINFSSHRELARVYVVVCVVQEVYTCLGIPPTIPREMVVSLEKEEQGGIS